MTKFNENQVKTACADHSINNEKKTNEKKLSKSKKMHNEKNKQMNKKIMREIEKYLLTIF